MPRKSPAANATKAPADRATAREPRKVKPQPKRGRPQSDTSPAIAARIWSPTELAAEIGYSRDTLYKWEGQGLERATGGKGFTMAAVIAFIAGRERAAGRMEADPDDVLEAEKLRDLRARADMREDERDKSRRELIEIELAAAIYRDDSAHVAVHLRSLGARLMSRVALESRPDVVCAMIDREVEQALSNLNADHVDPNSPDAHPYVGGVEITGRG